ncbi:MAG: hypothetical protein WAR58_00560 [Sphingorhabdus sp.]
MPRNFISGEDEIGHTVHQFVEQSQRDAHGLAALLYDRFQIVSQQVSIAASTVIGSFHVIHIERRQKGKHVLNQFGVIVVDWFASLQRIC